MAWRLTCVSCGRVPHSVAQVYNASAESLHVEKLGMKISKTVRTHVILVFYQLDFWYVASCYYLALVILPLSRQAFLLELLAELQSWSASAGDIPKGWTLYVP